MEPTNTIVTIQNPGEESIVINPYAVLTATQVAEQYGGKIKHGAFVSIAERNGFDNTTGGSIFVADRDTDGILYLQNNEYMNDGVCGVDTIGAVAGSADVPLEPDPADLETFTVFGNNDDNEDFVAVVTATEDTVYSVGVQAGLVDEGYEEDVDIVLIVKGDQRNLERVTA